MQKGENEERTPNWTFLHINNAFESEDLKLPNARMEMGMSYHSFGEHRRLKFVRKRNFCVVHSGNKQKIVRSNLKTTVQCI